MVKSKGVRLRMLAYLRLKISSEAAVLVVTLGSTIAEILAWVGCSGDWVASFAVVLLIPRWLSSARRLSRSSIGYCTTILP